MKRRRLNKAGQNLLITMITIIGSIPFLYLTYDKFQNEVTIEKMNKQYEITITYPIVHQKNLDTEIKKYVELKKDTFLADMKKTTTKQSEQKFIFTMQYQFYKESQIYYVRLETKIKNEISEEIHYEEKTFHYDAKKKQYLNIMDYLKEPSEDSLKQLSNLSYYYIMEKLENENVSYDNEKIRSLIIATPENFKHFHPKEQGLEILFPTYQMEANQINEVLKIMIPLKEANELLKETYQIHPEKENEINENIQNKEETGFIYHQSKRDLSKYKNKKLVAFTFDDGPNAKTTNRLLDGVAKYDAKVTFFVLGSQVAQEQNQSVLKRAYQEGHTIGSHTYNHRNLLQLDDYHRMKEIKDTNDIIEQTIGVKPNLLRPPYGNINQDIKVLANMHIIEWNLDTLDWKSKNAEQVANEIISNVHDGSIILLHDIYETSVDGALLAMSKLEQEGYAFVTIPEMVELKNIQLDYTTSYRYFS